MGVHASESFKGQERWEPLGQSHRKCGRLALTSCALFSNQTKVAVMAENWCVIAREHVSKWEHATNASPGNQFMVWGGVCVLIPVWQHDQSPKAHQNARQAFYFTLSCSKNLLFLTETSQQLTDPQAFKVVLRIHTWAWGIKITKLAWDRLGGRWPSRKASQSH